MMLATKVGFLWQTSNGDVFFFMIEAYVELKNLFIEQASTIVGLMTALSLEESNKD